MLKGTSPSAKKEGGYTIGMSLVVLMLIVATLVPALDPMYGIPSCKTGSTLDYRNLTFACFFVLFSNKCSPLMQGNPSKVHKCHTGLDG